MYRDQTFILSFVSKKIYDYIDQGYPPNKSILEWCSCS